MRYVALLRGINVGGNRSIRMPALKECLEWQGFESVVTYIQSGNVIFTTNERSAAVVQRIEGSLAATFGFDVPIVLQSDRQLRRVVDEPPAGWRRGSDLRRNIAFLRPPVTAGQALEQVDVNDDVDAVSAGRGVLYMSTRMDALSRSRFNRVVTKPIYREMTIRTYNTCQKILALMR